MNIHDILFAAFLLAIGLIAVVGNTLVILAVFSHRKLHSPSNYLIVNLALSDLLQGAVSMPLRVAGVINTSHESPVRCDLVISMAVLFHGASNLNLGLIALDRFIAVWRPFAYANIVKTSTYKMLILCTWILILILSFSPVVGWRRGLPSGTPPSAVCRYNTTLTQEYLIMYVFLIDLIPLMVMLLTYTYIFRTTRKQIRQIRAQEIAVTHAAINQAFESRQNSHISDEEAQKEADIDRKGPDNCKQNARVPTNNNNQESVEHSRKCSTISNLPTGNSPTRGNRRLPLSSVRTRKATRIVLAIIGFYLVLCLPISIIDAVELWCTSCSNIPGWVTTIAICMVSANSCVNVFVYGGYNTEYRIAYRKVWQSTRQAVGKSLCTRTKSKTQPSVPAQTATG